jgi:hypothetical protein
MTVMSSLRFQKTFPESQVREIKIINPVGKVTVIGEKRTDIFLDFTVSAASTEVPRSKVPVIRLEDGLLYIRCRNTPFEDQDDWENADEPSREEQSDKEPVIRNEMTVQIPEGKHLDIRCLRGIIECRDVVGTFKVKTLNGPIKIQQCAGELLAKTTNGPISVQGGSFRYLKLKTINGPIRVYPESIAGDFQIKTVNGPIRVACPSQADLSLTVKSSFGPVKVSSLFNSEIRGFHQFKGVLNNGRDKLKIKSVSGPVSVTMSDTPSIPQNATDFLRRDPHDIIDRMVASGKITQEEAQRLKNAL